MIVILLAVTVLLSTLVFFAFLLGQQCQVVRLVVESLITVIDVLTLPVYCLLDKPWKVQRLSQTHWADRHYEPHGDYTYWECKARPADRNKASKYSRLCAELQNVGHLSELPPIVQKLYHNLDCVGRRKLIGKTVEKGATKFELGDFEWLTYAEAVRRINSLAKALNHKLHLKRGDRVAIMADTG